MPTTGDNDDFEVHDDNNLLIEDIFSPTQVSIPIAIKYWTEPSGGVDCFLKLPYNIIPQLTNAFGTSVVMETENRRIRVSSSEAELVEEAMEKLSNLGRSLVKYFFVWFDIFLKSFLVDYWRIRLTSPFRGLQSLVVAPRTGNKLNVGPISYNPRVVTYKNQNDLALSRILVDPDSKAMAMICHMYSTAVEFTNENTREITRPKNVSEPPRKTKPRKGNSKLWADFIFPELGDAENSPEPDISTGVEVVVREDPANHPFLSKEKATKIDKWVEGGAEASADGKPQVDFDFTLPPQPIPEPTPEPQAPKVIGIKKRRVAALDRSGPIKSAPAATPKDTIKESQDASQSSVTSRPAEEDLLTDELPLQTNPAPPKSESKPKLIDLFDDDITMPASSLPISSIPGMSWSQAPLEPLRLQAPMVQPTQFFPVSEGSLGPSLEGPKEDAASHRQVPRVKGIRRRTMKQKAGKKVSKAVKDRQAKLAEVWGAPAPSNKKEAKPAAAAPEPSAWKKEKLPMVEKHDSEVVQSIFSDLQHVLDSCRSFPGALSLRIQLGMVLIAGRPHENQINRPLRESTWNAMFRVQHGVPPPATFFVDRLTTSGADVDHIIDLEGEKNGVTSRMFSEEPSIRSVRYEFHCQTRAHEEVIIFIDQGGDAIVNRPEALLGSVNIHCPRSIWDMSVAVKGTQEYTPGTDAEVDNAIQEVISKLYVLPDKTQVMMFTTVPAGDELRITKVLMRRHTMHHYIQGDTAPETEKGKERESAESQPGLYLQVIEVQNLYIGHATDKKTMFRARALDPETMVDNSRLWYEVSIVSPGIDELLVSNKEIDLGNCTTAWSPVDLLGRDGGSPLSNVASYLGSAGLGGMFRLANQLVGKVDSVGWANEGPAVDIANPAAGVGSTVSRSVVGALPAPGTNVKSTAYPGTNVETNDYNVHGGQASDGYFW